MSVLKSSPFAEDLKHTLEAKRTHLAVFRLWKQSGGPEDFIELLEILIEHTTHMIDTLVDALRREGEPIPDIMPEASFIAEAQRQPTTPARARFAERFLRRSMAWYEERLSAAREGDERATWSHLFDLETENWARVENYLSP